MVDVKKDTFDKLVQKTFTKLKKAKLEEVEKHDENVQIMCKTELFTGTFILEALTECATRPCGHFNRKVAHELWQAMNKSLQKNITILIDEIEEE